jgi:hypothetical protein
MVSTTAEGSHFTRAAGFTTPSQELSIGSELRRGRPEYKSTVGATFRFQSNYNGKQPGGPAKAAAVLLRIASLPEPPLRLLLGSDCYAAVVELQTTENRAADGALELIPALVS